MGKKNFKKKGGKTLQERRKELKEASQSLARESKKENKKKSSDYTVDQLLDKAEELIDTFSYELAQKFCQRALEKDADNLRALETSGILLLELGNTEAAKQYFGRAVELFPDKGYSKYMYLGQLFEGTQAVECFQKGIQLMLKEKEEKQVQEVAAACRVLSDGPSDRDISNAYCSIAELYLTDLCFEDSAEQKCEENIDKAVTADPSNPEAHQLKASFLLSKEKTEEAREAIKTSVSLWLPELQAQDSGNIASELFDPVESCSLSFPARMQAGKILIEVSEYDMAAEILELLLDEDEDVPDVWYMLGWASYLQGPDYAATARHYLQKAQEVYTKVKHKDEELQQHLLELLQELGPGDEDEETITEDGAKELEIESSDEEPMDQ